MSLIILKYHKSWDHNSKASKVNSNLWNAWNLMGREEQALFPNMVVSRKVWRALCFKIIYECDFISCDNTCTVFIRGISFEDQIAIGYTDLHINFPPCWNIFYLNIFCLDMNPLRDVSLRSKRSSSTEEFRNDFPQTGRAKVGARDWGNACKKTTYSWKTSSPTNGDFWLVRHSRNDWQVTNFWAKYFLLVSSVTKTILEDVEGFQWCVEGERIGSGFYIEKGTRTYRIRKKLNCSDERKRRTGFLSIIVISLSQSIIRDHSKSKWLR